MRALRLALLLLIVGAVPAAMGGANVDGEPGDGGMSTLRGLTVLECDSSHRTSCTFVSKDGRIVFVSTDLEWWDRIPDVGVVVDVRARYWAPGKHRDAFRGISLDHTEPGWVRAVGAARCLVVHGHVGRVEDGLVQLLVPLRMTPTSFDLESAAEQLIAFQPIRSRLARMQTTGTNPRLRMQQTRALRLLRGKGQGFMYYEVVQLGSSTSMRAGRCR